MEKAKLTRAQERVLKSALITRQTADLVQEYAKAPGFFNAAYGSSAFMDLDTLCRALYVGYEIIEEDQEVVVTAQRRRQARAFREVAMVEKGNNGKDGFLWAEGFDDALEYFGIKL